MDHLLTQPLSRETEGKRHAVCVCVCVCVYCAMNISSFLVHVGGWIAHLNVAFGYYYIHPT